MISNATNPLKESRKESLLRCAGSTSICVWLVCDLVVMCVQAEWIYSQGFFFEAKSGSKNFRVLFHQKKKKGSS